jgi:DNA mismatch endonuclease (patch repair protein)
VVYIDGCFWHGCPVHASTPTSNIPYWVPKLNANRERDAAVTRLLREEGWTVLRFWEHESTEVVVDTIGEVADALRDQIS